MMRPEPWLALIPNQTPEAAEATGPALVSSYVRHNRSEKE